MTNLIEGHKVIMCVDRRNRIDIRLDARVCLCRLGVFRKNGRDENTEQKGREEGSCQSHGDLRAVW